MGLFKDLRDLSKAGKEIRKQQCGDTSSWTMMKQGVAQAKDELQQLATDQAKTQDLMTSGIAGKATIRGMRDVGVVVNEMPLIEMDLQVQVPDRDPYEVTHRQVMPHSSLGTLQLGATVLVRVDPQDPDSLVVSADQPDARSGPPSRTGD
jgi:hypothetical protein